MSDTMTQQTGYQAWLEYHPIVLSEVTEQYAVYSGIICTEKEEAIQSAVQELSRGISKMLGKEIGVSENVGRAVIALGTFGGGNAMIDRTFDGETRSAVKHEGFAIKTDQASGSIVIGASSASGVLYGVFHLLRLLALISQ